MTLVTYIFPGGTQTNLYVLLLSRHLQALSHLARRRTRQYPWQTVYTGRIASAQENNNRGRANDGGKPVN
jgi:hypothetical protein